ncbi:MAG: hypothetical protein IT214_07640 [Chitinophagaceae bacterium]|jgi:hypothetical protein|nr:hypothetical protein [Chitinophagaceae bacterium]OQY96365.1 MAG: hypothetical protein B6D37_02405 [Sphingobacteriales bacterium UTBCD1]
MKRPGFLFALYLLVVGCLPCNDSKACSHSNFQIIAAITNQEHHQNSKDICPPFCSCSCCSGFSINQAMSANHYSPVIFDTYLFLFSTGNLMKVSLPVWQPPKL